MNKPNSQAYEDQSSTRRSNYGKVMATQSAAASYEKPYFQEVQIFSHADMTVKRFSVNDVYRHAGMVLRDRHRTLEHQVVLFPGAASGTEERYTLEQLSRFVNEVLNNHRDDLIFRRGY